MIVTGTDLYSLLRMHQIRAVNRQIVRSGGEAILSLPRSAQEELTITIGGTVYPVFVSGLHNPDDIVLRYVL